MMIYPDTHAVTPIAGFSEPFSCFSHLFITPVFLVWGILLWGRARGRRWVSSFFVFATLMLLSISGVYHLLDPAGTPRVVLQRIDHATIFMFIAATFTPIHVVLFKGVGRWGVLLLIWALAVCGITLKTIFFGGVPEWLGLAFFLGLGWIGFISGALLWKRYGYAFVRPLLWGGIGYTLGAVFEFLRWPVLIDGVIGPHEVFHLAVLVGVSFHWVFIWRVVGVVEPLRRDP